MITTRAPDGANKMISILFSSCSCEDFILVSDLMDGSSWFSITIDGTDHKWKICETIVLFLWDPLQYTMFINKLVAKQEVISYDQRHSGRKIILLTKDVCFWNSHWLQKLHWSPDNHCKASFPESEVRGWERRPNPRRVDWTTILFNLTIKHFNM